jgi:hypothetical protein
MAVPAIMAMPAIVAVPSVVVPAAMPTRGGFRRGQGVTPIAAEAASARIVLRNMLFPLYAGLLAQPGVIVLLPFGSSTILALIG